MFFRLKNNVLKLLERLMQITLLPLLVLLKDVFIDGRYKKKMMIWN